MVVYTVLDDHPCEILTAGDSLSRYRRGVPDSPSRIFDKGDVTSEELSVNDIDMAWRMCSVGSTCNPPMEASNIYDTT